MRFRSFGFAAHISLTTSSMPHAVGGLARPAICSMRRANAQTRAWLTSSRQSASAIERRRLTTPRCSPPACDAASPARESSSYTRRWKRVEVERRASRSWCTTAAICTAALRLETCASLNSRGRWPSISASLRLASTYGKARRMPVRSAPRRRESTESALASAAASAAARAAAFFPLLFACPCLPFLLPFGVFFFTAAAPAASAEASPAPALPATTSPNNLPRSVKYSCIMRPASCASSARCVKVMLCRKSRL